MELTILKKLSASALFHFSLLLLTLPVFAAPAKSAAEPVAEGYPAWSGILPKNHILGRVLMSESDLRQRAATVVVEFDANKAAEQLEKIGPISSLNGHGDAAGHGGGWESKQLPRDVMVIFVAHNAKNHDLVKDGMKYKETADGRGRIDIGRNRVPVYENVTFEGAPDNGGKLPFVYVMGYEGTEPLLKEPFGANTLANVRKVVAEQKSKLSKAELTWRPFYGYVAEPKHFKDIEKTLAKGKPLDPVEAKLKKSLASRDPEVSKEAQMLYDALAQTRSDMVWMVYCSFSECPHVAAYTLTQVLKYWPKTKKQVSAISDSLKANKAAQPLISIYIKIVQWSDPAFTCKNAGEAKKIVAELQKMKKTLEPIKEDAKNITVQNGALILDGMIDELIDLVPTKVPQK